MPYQGTTSNRCTRQRPAQASSEILLVRRTSDQCPNLNRYRWSARRRTTARPNPTFHPQTSNPAFSIATSPKMLGVSLHSCLVDQTTSIWLWLLALAQNSGRAHDDSLPLHPYSTASFCVCQPELLHGLCDLPALQQHQPQIVSCRSLVSTELELLECTIQIAQHSISKPKIV